MALRRKFANPVKDQRRRSRFARTRRTKQREMLAKHRINIERTAHIRGWIDRADFNIGMIVRGIKLTHIFRRDGINEIIGARITRNTATEIIDFAGQPLFIALTQKVDHRNDMAGCVETLAECADIGDQPRHADLDLNLAADLSGCGKAWVAVIGEGVHRLRTDQDT